MAFDLKGKAVRSLRLPTVDYTGAPIQLTQAKSGDINSRYFAITLYDDRGTIDLSLYTLVQLSATLPDETVQYYEGEIENGVVYVKLTSSMLSQSGRLSCDISLQGKDEHGEVILLTSQTFYVNVAFSQNSDGNGTQGEENLSILITLIDDVRELKSQLVGVKEFAIKAVDDLLARSERGDFNGQNGRDGRDGNNGRDGVDGQNGQDGRDGIDGQDGRDGLNGEIGRTGNDGRDGRDGRDGKDGKNGKDGIGFIPDAILTFICEDDEEYSFAMMGMDELPKEDNCEICENPDCTCDDCKGLNTTRQDYSKHHDDLSDYWRRTYFGDLKFCWRKLK